MLVTINSVFVTHVVTRPSVEEGQYAIDLDLANDRAKRDTRAALVERGPARYPGRRRWGRGGGRVDHALAGTRAVASGYPSAAGWDEHVHGAAAADDVDRLDADQRAGPSIADVAPEHVDRGLAPQAAQRQLIGGPHGSVWDADSTDGYAPAHSDAAGVVEGERGAATRTSAAGKLARVVGALREERYVRPLPTAAAGQGQAADDGGNRRCRVPPQARSRARGPHAERGSPRQREPAVAAVGGGCRSGER